MRSTLSTLAVLACLVVDASVPAVRAQTPSDARFDVASIKPNKSGDLVAPITIQPGGRFTATNAPLSQLIRYAHQLPRFQMDTPGGWMSTERFDVIAKAEGDVPQAPPNTVGPVHVMLQALLIDRFKLVMHHEQREQPIYALVVARSDGRLGPQLKPSSLDCQRRTLPAPDGPRCGLRAEVGQFKGGGVTMLTFASALSSMLQQAVVDRSGLEGSYDLALAFTPDQPGGRGAPPDATAPSLFTAMQEQLGLKLTAQRGPVDVLVIDSAERPKED